MNIKMYYLVYSHKFDSRFYLFRNHEDKVCISA